MEILENTNGAVTKLTEGDGGHAPMPPLGSGYAHARGDSSLSRVSVNPGKLKSGPLKRLCLCLYSIQQFLDRGAHFRRPL